ncbi:MAG: E3 binding domain-containing protein [Gemmatimonadetes bacterium]|nr:E3 binding domain-containing protein [Gemmatimonadota bacterium]
MAVDVVMPRLGWTMEEGTLVEWTRQDGDAVAAGEVIMLVESDKAVTEVESFDEGILRTPPDSPPPGTTVPIGTLLAFILQPGEEMPEGPSGSPPEAAAPAPPGPAPAAEPETAPPRHSGAALEAAPAAPPVPGRTPVSPLRGRRGPAISPRARRVAVELGIDWKRLSGSGRTGRIVERDVRAAAETASAAPALAAPAPAAASQAVEVDVTAFAGHCDRLAVLMKRAPVVPGMLDLVLRSVGRALAEAPSLAGAGAGVRVQRDGFAAVLKRFPSLSVLDICGALADDETAEAGAVPAATPFGVVALEGVDSLAPGLPPGAVAVLGLGAVREKEGDGGTRKSLNLRMTYDLFAVADAEAQQFLGALRSYLEDPFNWLSW